MSNVQNVAAALVASVDAARAASHEKGNAWAQFIALVAGTTDVQELEKTSVAIEKELADAKLYVSLGDFKHWTSAKASKAAKARLAVYKSIVKSAIENGVTIEAGVSQPRLKKATQNAIEAAMTPEEKERAAASAEASNAADAIAALADPAQVMAANHLAFLLRLGDVETMAWLQDRVAKMMTKNPPMPEVVEKAA